MNRSRHRSDKTPGKKGALSAAADKKPASPSLEPTVRLERGAKAPGGSPVSSKDTGQTLSADPATSPLQQLLHAADRRLFPGLPPVQIDFPSDDAGVEDLLPSDLIDDMLSPVDDFEDPALEQLTSTFAPDDQLTRPFITQVFRHHEPQGHKVSYGDATVLAPLWQWITGAVNVCATLTPAGQAPLTLTLEGGLLVELEGHVATWVLKQTNETFLASPHIPLTETSAMQTLERAIAAGRLSRFEVERSLRLRRELLLADLVTVPLVHASSVDLQETRGHPSAPKPLLSRSLLGLLFAAARQGLQQPQVLGLLGPDTQRLRLGSQSTHDMQVAEIEPETIACILAGDGKPLHDLLRSTPNSTGMAGLVYSLHVVGSLVLVDS